MESVINDIYINLKNNLPHIKNNIKYSINKLSNYNFQERSIFIPKKIVDWIIKHTEYNYKFIFVINNRTINVNLYSDKKINNINFYLIKIKLILHILTHYTSINCSKNIDIKIYLTPFKKFWDKKTIIDQFNVNTGYSTIGCISDSKLLIFRKEEWFKVLIHELMHNLNLDFADIFREKYKNILKDNFFIDSKYDLSESYCEFWARHLNLIINTFLKSKENDNFSIFYKNYNNILRQEVIFSLQQANKLSAFIYLSNYREKTNVFSYYILTSVLMFYSEDFIIWCKKNNNNKFINFKKKDENIIKFINFIISKYYNINYYNALQKSLTNNNSMRMTIIS